MKPPAIFAFAVAAPIGLAMLVILVFSGSELAGHTPFSYGPPQNVAEAAAMGTASEVMRLLGEGQDPNRMWPVRRDIISSTVTRVSGLEAAIWSRDAQLLELLDRRGAIVDVPVRRYLSCLAGDIRAQEIVDYLAVKEGPPCVPDEAVTAIVARSRVAP